MSRSCLAVVLPATINNSANQNVQTSHVQIHFGASFLRVLRWRPVTRKSKLSHKTMADKRNIASIISLLIQLSRGLSSNSSVLVGVEAPFQMCSFPEYGASAMQFASDSGLEPVALPSDVETASEADHRGGPVSSESKLDTVCLIVASLLIGALILRFSDIATADPMGGDFNDIFGVSVSPNDAHSACAHQDLKLQDGPLGDALLLHTSALLQTPPTV